MRISLPASLFVLLLGATIGLAGLTLTTSTAASRIALAVLLIVTFALISVRNARLATVLVLGFLPLLALVRRLLIPLSGWTSYDALLLVAPIVSILLLHRLFMMERRPLARDLFSKLVVGLVVLAVIEVLNPGGGGLMAGVTGLLFLAAPLFWFFIGRELADRQLVDVLLSTMLVLGIGIAIYGLWQILVGMPAWDAAWVGLNRNGYTALGVLGATRAFGTFSSGAEYAAFLGLTLVVALVMVLHGRLIAVLAVPVIGYALFLESSRGIIVFVMLAMVALLGMRSGRLRLTVLGVLVLALGAWGTVHFLGPQLTAMALRTGNPFIAHQVSGLLNPLDPTQSTLLLHEQIVLDGLSTSAQHPLGLGTATTNLAGQRLAATTAGTEVDIVNAFVSLGLLGGFMFLGLVIVAFARAGRLGLSRHDVPTLAMVGVLIVTGGQWLNGGYYAVAPLVWLLIGWANREWLAQRDRAGDIMRVTTPEGWLVAAKPSAAATG